MNIAIWGACREGVDCLHALKAAHLLDNMEFCFLDNDERVIGSQLENCVIHHGDTLMELNLDMIVIAVIDTEKILHQIKTKNYAGKIKLFYGDQYFSKVRRKIGMASIGAYSYFKPSTFLYNVNIGNYCHIGADCRLGLIGHDHRNLTTYPLKLKSLSHEFAWEGETKKRLQPLVIEDDVYIGEGVSIMAGLTIGRGAVIGSKSLITADVEPYSVMGGVPGKKITDRLSTSLKEALSISGWTTMDIDDAIARLKQITF